jgi:hypothetical protein
MFFNICMKDNGKTLLKGNKSIKLDGKGNKQKYHMKIIEDQ